MILAIAGGILLAALILGVLRLLPLIILALLVLYMIGQYAPADNGPDSHRHFMPDLSSQRR